MSALCLKRKNGANALAEGFLFGVASLLIIGETWRSSRNQSKRRDSVDDQLEELQTKLQQLTDKTMSLQEMFEERWSEEKQRNDELSRILERVVEIGLRGGWAEFEDTPLALPRIRLSPTRSSEEPTSSPNAMDNATTDPLGTSSDPPSSSNPGARLR
ncbi:uncharacterized protein FIBRA_06744 [Fibroporia radiculosa]|uniref:OPA3-domain-containing protein n=1 Tax=Fibroporia radiculosa TaxID=599839 RepID=J4GCD6_9APHY|nr:uncharacterized protein FIBRA_06744 [Fibroporia radiculosa]CCM04563.1 predicted protein [Fibroporia radiculosa]